MVILDGVCCYVEIITVLLGDEWLYLMEYVAM